MLLRVLDLIAILAALAAAFLWFKASGHRVRRIARDEELDAADFNRLIVAVNRAQILNSRAAMATAASALALALRMAYDLFAL
jgi:hypothetical protein